MGGGLLNLSAVGTENIMLFGNPQRSYWQGCYAKFTNFGIQSMRVDYTGQPALRDSESTRIRFPIPRNADLVAQTYVSITLPDIYSALPAAGTYTEPIHLRGDGQGDDPYTDPLTFQPYEFQWNEKLGFSCMERIEIYIGGHLIEDYTGEFLAMSQERDGDAKQDELLDEMIGQSDELTDPAKAVFQEMQQVQNTAYDILPAALDNVMLSRMAPGGQMAYSGAVNGLLPINYLKATDYTTGNGYPEQYSPYVLNSYPHSWPWAPANTAAANPPWTAQYPFPEDLAPAARDLTDCTVVNTPSIRGRQLLVPLNPWFGRNSKAALPLVALQYADVEIFVTFRPLNEWFTILKYMPPPGGYTGQDGDYSVNPGANGIGTAVSWSASRCNPPSTASGYTGIADSNTTIWSAGFQQRVAPQYGGYYDYLSAFGDAQPLHLFSPAYYTPDPKNLATFLNPNTTWDPEIHLIANYVFLEEDEQSLFAQDEQTYLVRTTHDNEFYGVRTADSVDIETYGLIASLTWRFRRSDVQQRNQWLNYTNWRFLQNPNTLPMVLQSLGYLSRQQPPSAFAESNEKHILQELSIWMEGKERETEFARGVWEWMQKYQRSNAGFKEMPGLDFYTFEVKTNPASMQPSGAFNMSKYRRLTLMFTLLQAPLDPTFNNNVAAGQTQSIALPGGGSEAVCLPVFNKNTLQNLAYNYDLNVYVEKYNMLVITNGLAGLAFTR